MSLSSPPPTSPPPGSKKYNHKLASLNYKDHQNELVSKYPDKYLIIKDQKVISAFETLAEAIDYANANGLIEGEYLLQLCAKKRRGLACVFRSRAYFKDVI